MLHSLSAEILDDIACYLKRADQLSLLCVSNYLRQIVESHLYRTVAVKLRADNEVDHSSQTTQASRLRERPDLADTVQTCELYLLARSGCRTNGSFEVVNSILEASGNVKALTIDFEDGNYLSLADRIRLYEAGSITQMFESLKRLRLEFLRTRWNYLPTEGETLLVDLILHQSTLHELILPFSCGPALLSSLSPAALPKLHSLTAPSSIANKFIKGKPMQRVHVFMFTIGNIGSAETLTHIRELHLDFTNISTGIPEPEVCDVIRRVTERLCGVEVMELSCRPVDTRKFKETIRLIKSLKRLRVLLLIPHPKYSFERKKEDIMRRFENECESLRMTLEELLIEGEYIDNIHQENRSNW